MTTATEFGTRMSEFELTDNLRRLELSLRIADERLNRLLRTAFRDGDLSIARFHRLVRVEGPDAALAIAEGRGSLPRILWMGQLRGGRLTGRAERHEAEEAIKQLRPALVERQDLMNAHDDVRGARLRFLEERDRSRLIGEQHERDRGAARESGRNRDRKS